jgi:solute carrier family 15 (peptide/histidine transporter), member 3/4
MQVQSWDPINALTAVFVINGVTCLSAPLGGILSDSLIGRYWAVLLGTVFYITGYALLTALSINKLTPFGCDLKPNGFGQLLSNSSHPCSPHIYVILVLIGFGVGCVRANITPFLAEQVRVGSQNAVRQFFNAYYWCANFGAVIGVGVLSYIMENLENGFFIAFVTATSALCASLIFFCCGRCFYVIHRPGKSVIINIFRIMAEGTKNTCRKNITSSSPVMRRISAASSGISVALGPSSWVDRAKISYGGSFHDATVDDVKRLAKNMAFILFLLPYWLVYFQMSTLFQAQGLHMRVGLNGTTEDFVVSQFYFSLNF